MVAIITSTKKSTAGDDLSTGESFLVELKKLVWLVYSVKTMKAYESVPNIISHVPNSAANKLNWAFRGVFVCLRPSTSLIQPSKTCDLSCCPGMPGIGGILPK